MNPIQFLSLAGAGAILLAFALQLQGRWHATEPRYLWANFLGSAVLTGVAWVEAQWGFLVLETAWAAVSGWGLVRLLRTA